MIGLTQGTRVGLQFWQAQNVRRAEVAEVDPSRRILRALLTTIPIQPTVDSGPVAIGFKGLPDRIFLVGELPTGLGVSQRVDMTIHLLANRAVISWVPHHHESSQAVAPIPNDTELIRGVDRLEFAYWGKASLVSGEAWLTDWDDTVLPKLIRVRVHFSKGNSRRWPDLIAAPELRAPSS
jgi:hypothetical protein